MLKILNILNSLGGKEYDEYGVKIDGEKQLFVIRHEDVIVN